MSTVSPQFFSAQSSTDAAFNDSNFQDPYLSAPSDPEEESFRSSGIRLTPVTSNEPAEHCNSPSNFPINGNSASNYGSPTLDPSVVHAENFTGAATSFQDLLSPSDDVYRALSGHTSPNGDFFAEALDAPPHLEPTHWQHDGSSSRGTLEASRGGLGTGQGHIQLPQVTSQSSQLLSPDLTSHSSPSSDVATTRMVAEAPETQISLQASQSSGVLRLYQMPTLITSPDSDNLNVHLDPDSARAKSPIVKVESYSRGDSPVRETAPSRRRPSQSLIYLSPGDMGDSSSESENGETADDRSLYSQSVVRAGDGSWVPNSVTGQAGVDPTSRGNGYVPSPNELQDLRQLDEKNADIRTWSASVSAANSEAGDDDIPQHRGRRGETRTRRRAKSAGDPSIQQDYFTFKSRLDDFNIPGPGALVHESSEDEGSESEAETPGSGSQSPAVSVNQTRWSESAQESVPAFESPKPENEEPLPRQFFRLRPWQDIPLDRSLRTKQMQPQSSNAAMVEFQRRAKDIETASHRATRGTWNLSDFDVNSIIGAQGTFEKLSISNEKGKKERRNSIRQFLPKASNTLKRQLSELSAGQAGGDAVDKGNDRADPQKRDSTSSARSSVHLKLGIGRHARSPTLSTGGALIAMTGQMAAVGGRSSLHAASPSTGGSSWSNPLKGRGRSRSELPRPSTPGLMDLMTSHGGPPVANIAYSTNATPNHAAHSRDGGPAQNAGYEDEGEDEDDDGEVVSNEKGLVMDFSVSSRLPVPTLDGFKTQISQLNPRLQPALIMRLANEQTRRYKRLVEYKMNHSRAVGQNKCTAGRFCFAQGGEATILPPRTSPQDPDATYTQFHIPGHEDSGNCHNALGEGAVTAAQFPPGLPLPPVKRLPAEFECPLCFKVKKFQKPSDWTKHVHEDVQPFTCTFPDCNEPKSFKRKADWVRHESERHRKLEWWTCAVADCNHTCYRKDNFVQHLVREHKMPEPKPKKMKAKGAGVDSSTASPGLQEEGKHEKEIEELWAMVDNCRCDTTKDPREERCRFCGNICSTWKKLTVHLAKHMEQIAMPVLQLVNERGFSQSATLNPIEPPVPELLPASTSEEAADMLAYPNEIKKEPELAAGFSRLQSSNDRQSFPAPSNYSYPHPMSVPSSFTNMHPVSTSPSNHVAHYAPMDIPDQSMIHASQAQFLPVHQNSVTYPPPFNAVPRQRGPNQNGLAVLQNPYNNLSLSTADLGPIYDPHRPLYASPTAESSHGYQGHLAQPGPFDTPSATDYQTATEVGTNHISYEPGCIQYAENAYGFPAT